MAVRLIEVTLPADDETTVESLGGEAEVIHATEGELTDGRRRVVLLVEADQSEAVLEGLRERLDDGCELNAWVTEGVARLPEPEATGEDDDDASEAEEEWAWGWLVGGRVSRDELLETMTPGTRVDAMYLGMTALSTVIAAGGLLRDSVAVVVGAMMIAPLLLPNTALALAILLGKPKMILRTLGTNAAGLALAMLIAYGLGLGLGVEEAGRQIAMRTAVWPWDVAIALAAGAAGAVAVTSGVSLNMIGVMVAVALLPPLAVSGLMAGAGRWHEAGGAALLTGVNVACVNVAAMATFLLRGVRPWRREDRHAAFWVSLATIAGWVLVVGATVGLVWWAGVFERA